MKCLKIPYVMLCMLLLFSLINTQEIEIKEIKGPVYEGEEKMDAYTRFFKLLVTDGTHFIRVETTPKNNENPINFFIDTSIKPTYQSSRIKSLKGGVNQVILQLDPTETGQVYYLSLTTGDPNADFHLSYQELSEHSIKVGDEINLSAILQPPYIFRPTDADKQKKVYFYAIAGNTEDFELLLEFHRGATVLETIKATKHFSGGFGHYIDLANTASVSDPSFYIQASINQIRPDISDVLDVKFGLKYVQENESHMYFFNEIVGYLDNANPRVCWPAPTIETGKTEKIIFNIINFPQFVTLTLRDVEKKVVDNFETTMDLSDATLIEIKNPNTKWICIEKNKSDITKFTTYSVQALKYATLSMNQEYVAPLVNGVQMKFILPPGEVMTFRRRRFALNSKYNEFNLRPAQGDSSLLSYQCLLYPCELTKEEIDKQVLTRAHDVNGDQHLSIEGSVSQTETFYSSYKLLGVVECNEEEKDCEFYITMYYETEEVQLVQGQKYKMIASPNYNVHRYNFVLGFESVQYLRFSLYCYSGDASIVVTRGGSGTKHNNFYGNLKTVTMTKDDNTNLLDTYTVTITSPSSSYYSILVETSLDSKQSMLLYQSGEVQMYSMTKSEGSKELIFTNLFGEKPTPYVITLQPVNCAYRVQFNDEPEEDLTFEKQYFKAPKEGSTTGEIYKIKLTVKDAFGIPIDDRYTCMIYVSGIEIDAERKKDVILSENVDHYIEESDSGVKEMTYTFPFTYSDDLTQIIIDLSYFKKDYSIAIQIVYKGKEVSKSEQPMIINRGRRIIQKLYNFKSYCEKYKLCLMELKIEGANTTNWMIYRVNVKTSNAYPIFYKKDMYRKGVVDYLGVSYFYTDVALNEMGEVMVTFNRGNGAVFAKLVKKEDQETHEKSWNNRLLLPSRNSDPATLLPFDYFNKRIVFGTTDTSKCTTGCELHIGVISEVIPEDVQYSYNIAEFSVVFRGIGLESISFLMINEFAYGSLASNADRDSYLFNIPFDTKEMRIHLQSDFSYISIIKGTNIPQDVTDAWKGDWQLLESTGLLVIKVSDPVFPAGTASLRGLNFGIVVRAYTAIDYSARYALKVDAANLEYPITVITSEQNEVCVFDENKKFCYLVRSVNYYENLQDFNLYVESIDNGHNHFVIYGRVLTVDDYEKNFKETDLPSEQKKDFSSMENVNKNFLEVDLLSKEGNYYIVFAIEARLKGKALVLSSSHKRIDSTSLNQNSKTLFNVDAINLFGIHFNGGAKYLASFILLSGNGYVNTAKGAKILFEDSMLVEVEDTSSKFDITIETLHGVIFYVNYVSIDDTKPQLKELAFGKDNMILTDPINLNDAYYFKVLSDSNDKKHVIINFKMAHYEIDGALQGTEDFEITAYLTDIQFIRQATKDPLKIPTDSTPIRGVYNPLARVGLVEIKSFDKIVTNSETNYIYIKVNKSSSNLNKYKKLNFELSAISTGFLNSIYSFPNNNYYYNRIESPSQITVLQMTKRNKNEKKMLIEFASCVEDDSLLLYAIKNYANVQSLTDESIKVTDPTLVIKSSIDYGRVRIEIDIEKIDSIAFIVFAKADAKELLNYVVKYRTVAEVSSGEMFLPKRSLSVTYDSTKAIMKTKWGKPQLQAGPTTKTLDFIYKIFYRGTQSVPPSIPSICLIKGGTPLYSKRYTKDIPLAEEIETIEEIKLDKGIYAEVQVIVVLDEVDEEKMLSYNTEMFKTDNPSPEPEINEIRKPYNEQEKMDGYVKFYKIYITDGTQFIKITTIPTDPEKPINFFLDSVPRPTYEGSRIKSMKGGQNQIILQSNPAEKGLSYYLSMNTQTPNADFRLIYEELKENLINPGDEVSLSALIQPDKIWRPKEEDFYKKVYFYATSGNVKDFSLTLEYYKGQGDKPVTITPAQHFKTGFGHLVELNKIITLADIPTFYVKVKLSDLKAEVGYITEVKFGMKYITVDAPNLYFFDEIIGYLDNTNNEICYPVPTVTSPTGMDLIVNIISEPQTVKMASKDASRKVIKDYAIDAIASVLVSLKSDNPVKWLCMQKAPSTIYQVTTFTLQVFNHATIEEHQAYISPILNGYHTKFILPPGKALTLRRRRFAKDYRGTELHLKPVVGQSRLYAFKCLKFPCILTKTQVEESGEIRKAYDINEDFHLSIPFSETYTENFYSSYKQLAVVTCNEQVRNCIFYATMYFEEETVELVAFEKFKTLATTNLSKHKYTFDMTFEGVKTVTFKLYCYTGDAMVTVKNAKAKVVGKEQMIGSSKSIIYQTENSVDLMDKYSLTVEVADESYYGISVEMESDTLGKLKYIESGEIQMQTQSKKNGERTYLFVNRVEEQKYSYVISIQPVNCIFKVQFEDKATEDVAYEKQYIIKPKTGTEADIYTLKMTASSHLEHGELKDENFLCMFYVAGVELIREEGKRKDVLLTENVDHFIEQFDEHIVDMTYSYPFSYQSDLTLVIIDFTYFKKNFPVKIQTIFEGETVSSLAEIQLNRGRRLIGKAEDFKRYCKVNSLCNLRLRIVPVNPGDYLIYRINVKTSQSPPVYLKPSVYRKTVVDIHGFQYFFTDLMKDNEGEVMVTFNRGNGQVFARIVEKNAVDPEGWNNHVQLPTSKSDPKVLLPFDYFNKRFQFSKADTAKCTNGCELYIGVSSEAVFDDPSKALNIAEFSIIVRGLGISSSSFLSINDYAYGSLSDNNDQHVYFISIPFDTQEIKIHLQSNFGILYVANGLTPSTTGKVWEFLDPTGIFTIRVGDKTLPEGTTTLNNLSFAITVKAIHAINFSERYAIKVDASSVNSALTVMTSEQNEICVFESDNSPCYLVRSVNYFEGIIEFNLYVESIDNAHNKFLIYAKVFSADEYETKFKSEDLPSESKHDFTSQKNSEKAYIKIDLKNQNTNFYIVLCVKALKKGKATVLSSSMKNVQYTSLNQNSKTLFNLDATKAFGIHFNGGARYLASFILLSGNGFIVTHQGNRYVFEDSVLLEIDDRANQFDIAIESAQGVIFYVTYYSINKEAPQLKELAFGKDNMIIADTTNFDDAYYFKVLNDSNDRKHAVINFKLAQYKIETFKGTEDFDITAYMTDYNFIVQAMKDPKKIPDGSTPLKASYNPISRAGIIELKTFDKAPKTNTEDNDLESHAIFIKIKPGSENKNIYSKLTLEVSATPTGFFNSIYGFPNNNYYYNTIDSASQVNLLQLTKRNNNELKMVIEFASCIEDDSIIDFAIRKYVDIESINDAKLKTNDTTLGIVGKRQYGKVIVEVNIDTADSIAFAVFSKKPTTTQMNYVIKYRTFATLTTDTSVSIPKPELTVEYNDSTQKLSAKFNPPTSSLSSSIDIDYILRVFNRGTGSNLPANKISNICLIAENSKGFNKRYAKKSSSSIETLEETLKDISPGTQAEVSVVAFIDDVDDEKILGYDAFLLKLGDSKKPVDPVDPLNPDKPSVKFPTWAYYLIGGVCCAIIIIASSFFIARYLKRRRLETETAAILGGPTMPLVDNE